MYVCGVYVLVSLVGGGADADGEAAVVGGVLTFIGRIKY